MIQSISFQKLLKFSFGTICAKVMNARGRQQCLFLLKSEVAND